MKFSLLNIYTVPGIFDNLLYVTQSCLPFSFYNLLLK